MSDREDREAQRLQRAPDQSGTGRGEIASRGPARAYTSPPEAPGKHRRVSRWSRRARRNRLLAALAFGVGGAVTLEIARDFRDAPRGVANAWTRWRSPRTVFLGDHDYDRRATEKARAIIASGTLPPPLARSALSSPPLVVEDLPSPVALGSDPPEPRPVSRTTKTDAELERDVRAMLERAPAETRQEIAEGREVLYALHVFDNVAQDGDRVAVYVNGVAYGEISMMNAGQDFIIPLPAGSTATIQVVATHDGGGGVTFGAATSFGEMRSVIMAVGESDVWTIVVQ